MSGSKIPIKKGPHILRNFTCVSWLGPNPHDRHAAWHSGAGPRIGRSHLRGGGGGRGWPRILSTVLEFPQNGGSPLWLLVQPTKSGYPCFASSCVCFSNQRVPLCLCFLFLTRPKDKEIEAKSKHRVSSIFVSAAHRTWRETGKHTFWDLDHMWTKTGRPSQMPKSRLWATDFLRA